MGRSVLCLPSDSLSDPPGRGPFFHDSNPFLNRAKGTLNFQNLVYCKSTDTQHTLYQMLLPTEHNRTFTFWKPPIASSYSSMNAVKLLCILSFIFFANVPFAISPASIC
jgi:hypothetical protein